MKLTMFPMKRRATILDMLQQEKMMKLPILAERLGVSMETLRRDIAVLVEEGAIEKVYGGIKLKEEPLGESLIEQRLHHALPEKKQIATYCRSLIQEGDCIYLDSGSTTLQLAHLLQDVQRLTVVTNSLPIVMALMHTEIEVLLIGGKLRRSEQSIMTYDFLFNFDQLTIHKAFICASGVSLEKGVSDYSLEEATTRKKMIEIATHTYLMVDHSKFERDVFVHIAPLSAFDTIITDEQLEDATYETYVDAGVSLHRAT